MFEPDPELAAMLAWNDAVRAELSDDDEVPGWVIAQLPCQERRDCQVTSGSLLWPM